MRWRVRSILVAALVLSLTSCSFWHATGTYLGRLTNGVIRLQLVQVDEHAVSGQFDQAVFDANGVMTSESGTVVGTIDGSSIALKITGNGLPPATTSGSGEFTWNGLVLTGNLNSGKLATYEFVRGDDSSYQAELKRVTSAADALVAQRQRERVAAAAMRSYRHDSDRHDIERHDSYRRESYRKPMRWRHGAYRKWRTRGRISPASAFSL